MHQLIVVTVQATSAIPQGWLRCFSFPVKERESPRPFGRIWVHILFVLGMSIHSDRFCQVLKDIIQLSQLILFFDIDIESKLSNLYLVLASMGDQISVSSGQTAPHFLELKAASQGVYPTAIIVLVHIQRNIDLDDSNVHATHVDSGARKKSKELTTIQFNPGAPTHTVSTHVNFSEPPNTSSTQESSIPSRYESQV